MRTYELAKLLLLMPDKMCSFTVDTDVLELNNLPYEDGICELFVNFEFDWSDDYGDN